MLAFPEQRRTLLPVSLSLKVEVAPLLYYSSVTQNTLLAKYEAKDYFTYLAQAHLFVNQLCKLSLVLFEYIYTYKINILLPKTKM